MKYLVVGLGNWPKEYQKNRHNIGFMFLDNLFGKKFKITANKGNLVLFKPQTMMNSSGKGIKRKLDKLNIPVENLVVVYDDIHLPFGTLRYREKGSAGGHNGIKSIINELETIEFKRIKVGIGQSTEKDLIDFVLSDFTDEEMTELPGILEGVERILGDQL